MRRHLFGCAAATVVILTTSVAAQNRPPQTPSPTQPRADQQMRSPTATVEGCLMNESDVPGRKPNIAERAGVLEDYILTNAKVVKGKEPMSAAPPSADRPAATPDRKKMFKVTGIDDDELKKHVGRRVQIEGTFANLDQTRDTPERSTPADDLAEIRGTTIRQVGGACSN